MPNKIDKLNVTRARILKAMSDTKDILIELEKDSAVSTYIKQGKKIIGLNEDLKKIDTKIREETILNCSHISIISSMYSLSSGCNDQIYRHYRCLKCEMDTRKFDGIYPEGLFDGNIYQSDFMLEKIERELRKGIITDIICSDDTVKLIYNNIIAKYPNITDEQVVIHIKRIINLIKNKNKSNEERALILANPHKYIL